MSEMKITIKKEKKKDKSVTFENIEKGTVYQINCGATLLKLDCDDAVILTSSNGRGWFSIAAKGEGNFNGRPATKILGKLTEIIVDPNVRE